MSGRVSFRFSAEDTALWGMRWKTPELGRLEEPVHMRAMAWPNCVSAGIGLSARLSDWNHGSQPRVAADPTPIPRTGLWRSGPGNESTMRLKTEIRITDQRQEEERVEWQTFL